jgi:hypothetical protein
MKKNIYEAPEIVSVVFDENICALNSSTEATSIPSDMSISIELL